MVERLRNAGAIIIGKTNAPEFGLGSHTYNPVYARDIWLPSIGAINAAIMLSRPSSKW
jgi:amidase